MPSTGTAEIGGKQYTWSSPRLADIMQIEETPSLGQLSDVKFVNSVKGRAHFAALCLREHHPDLTPGVILTWDTDCYYDLWLMLLQAIPYLRRFFEVIVPTPPAPSESTTSSPSGTSPDGPPTPPAASE